MIDKISVKPDTIFLEDLIVEIARGKYKIPEFQRNFVWGKPQIIALFDSISKGYPIGSLLFWNTDQKYKTNDKIGPYYVYAKCNEIRYVLDGFQRMSTLYGVLMDPSKFEKDNNNLKNFSIFFDLQNKNFSYIKSKKDGNVLFPQLYEIYDNRLLFDFCRLLDQQEHIDRLDKIEYIESARNLHDILHKYKIPLVEITGGSIKSAVEIFSRVNSKGTDISEDYMISALNYNLQTEFLLSNSITKFLDKLSIYNFKKLKRDTVLNCISNSLDSEKIYFDLSLENIHSQEKDLEELTKSTYPLIEKTVNFLYKKLFVIEIGLLPYPSQLIFICQYFNSNPEPTHEQYEDLKRWFWFTTYSNYFTIYSISQQRSAYKKFSDFAKGENNDGIYRVDPNISFYTAKYPDKLNFTSVRTKALQLFYLRNSVDTVKEGDERKEFYIFRDKGKNPANMIIRLSSDVESEENRNTKSVDEFIRDSSIDILERHFISEEIRHYFFKKNMEAFINNRQQYIQSKEQEFIKSLGISVL